ncbi:MAG: hypothetical protein CVV44_11380 [Spirochaetae bacterium HGW-Spirochaetae-1]|nr:MAG: hypothetical protein CVV44_11380 [Spirochaetae bacterium HGW-Spirochaetae-1]
MSKFESVTIIKKANIYFDGNVTSRSVEFSDGSKITLGIMLKGEYTFNTGVPELMEIQSGSARYKLKDDKAWTSVTEGGSFSVPENSSFTIIADTVVDYCCYFLEK